ncbi:N-acetylgalactosamine kinase AgaK [Trichinella pseudospiralis]
MPTAKPLPVAVGGCGMEGCSEWGPVVYTHNCNSSQLKFYIIFLIDHKEGPEEARRRQRDVSCILLTVNNWLK